MAKKKPVLADYVEAIERKAAPKPREYGNDGRGWHAPWLWVLVLTVVLLAIGIGYLRYRQII